MSNIFPSWLKQCHKIEYIEVPTNGGFGGGGILPKRQIVVTASVKINKKKNNIRVTAKYLNMRSL
jgi:hypothetical protein